MAIPLFSIYIQLGDFRKCANVAIVITYIVSCGLDESIIIYMDTKVYYLKKVLNMNTLIYMYNI